MKPKPGEVRAARSFLRQRAKTGSQQIPPRQFAAAAKEQDVGFRELLGFISRLYAGGSQQGIFREELLRKAVSK